MFKKSSQHLWNSLIMLEIGWKSLEIVAGHFSKLSKILCLNPILPGIKKRSGSQQVQRTLLLHGHGCHYLLPVYMKSLYGQKKTGEWKRTKHGSIDPLCEPGPWKPYLYFSLKIQ